MTRWPIFAVPAILAAAALAAYANSFSGPFVFDDVSAITDNATIRSLIGSLIPPPNSTPSGRPFLNFTLALNYAAGGLEVGGYHAGNLLIHILAGLTFFGVLRRTFGLAKIDGRPELPALAAALLWTIHPLQTESVTYIVQRAESLMGFFYLLTLYCFIRGASGRESRLWFAAAVLACMLGGATKEVIVSAPLVVLLYDRAFLAGSFRKALRMRRKAYAGLACVWPELLLLATHSRSGSGFGIEVKVWDYYLTQFPAVVRYLWLCAWPHPLVFDYGTEWVKNPWDVAVPAAAVVVLLAGTVVPLWKWPTIGCAGTCFFAILAVTSLIPGNRQTMAEHRMYLALAPLLALATAGAWRLWGRRAIYAALALALAFGWLTFRRNRIYASSVALWFDTVAKRPNNPYAHYNLANVLASQPGREADAIAHYETALRLKPDYAETHNNFAVFLASRLGREADAIAHYETALRLSPDFAEAHNNLAALLASQPGREADAIAHYETALHLKPDYADAHNNLANLLAAQPGRQADAIAHYETALYLKPDFAEAHNNLAALLTSQPGREADAIAHYETAVQLMPNSFLIHFNLARELEKLPNRQDEAVFHYRVALQINPEFALAKEALQRLQRNGR